MIARRQFIYYAVTTLASACLKTALGQADDVFLEVTPALARTGDSVTIEWRAPSSADVYLVGVGHVGNSGHREITVASDTSILLIVEEGPRLIVKQAAVRVTGTKGEEEEDFEQNIGVFGHPYPFRLKPFAHYGEMIDALVSAVVEKLGALQK